jgi:hypothetical protein
VEQAQLLFAVMVGLEYPHQLQEHQPITLVVEAVGRLRYLVSQRQEMVVMVAVEKVLIAQTLGLVMLVKPTKAVEAVEAVTQELGKMAVKAVQA